MYETLLNYNIIFTLWCILFTSSFILLYSSDTTKIKKAKRKEKGNHGCETIQKGLNCSSNDCFIELENEVALVTGAAGGLGQQIVVDLLQKGNYFLYVCMCVVYMYVCGVYVYVCVCLFRFGSVCLFELIYIILVCVYMYTKQRTVFL